jgi:short-subunit dehydrogenase
MDTLGLDQRVVVITGASSGFGKGAALAFADHGAWPVLAARRSGLLDQLASECQQRCGHALAVPTDVSRREDVEHLMEAALAEFGRVDVWINNAGVGAIGPFEKVPLEVHAQVVETNLLGALYGSHLAYRQFVAQRHGVLINIASELGAHTVPYYASYVAAKHGVVGLSESLQQELLHKDIGSVHVCTVLPTAHDTPFFDHAANYTGHEVAAPQPLHEPQKVIDCILRLAADPEDESIVGYDGIVKILIKRWAPAIAERYAARSMHKTQIEKPPPAPDSPGAVSAPTPIGVGIEAGRRQARR